MVVTYFNREKRDASFSIEEVFNTVKNQLSDKIEIRDYYYKPFLGRLRSVFDVKKYQGDVNHITGDVHYLAMGLNPHKTIITIHDMGHFEEGLKRSISRYIYKFVWFDLPFRRIKYITTVSEFTKQRILTYFDIDPERIKVIHNPAPNDFNYSPKAAINKEEPVILQIGSSINKNVERLIEAVKDLKIKLVLVRRMNDKLLSLLKENNINYEWYKNLNREELYQKYCECDIVYFASTYEGFGVPILEANKIGRAVIVGNIASMPEVAGAEACLVNPFDVNEIRESITKIIHDDNYRNRIITYGVQNIERFRPEVISNQYLQLYKSIKSSV